METLTYGTTSYQKTDAFYIISLSHKLSRVGHTNQAFARLGSSFVLDLHRDTKAQGQRGGDCPLALLKSLNSLIFPLFCPAFVASTPAAAALLDMLVFIDMQKSKLQHQHICTRRIFCLVFRGSGTVPEPRALDFLTLLGLTYILRGDLYITEICGTNVIVWRLFSQRNVLGQKYLSVVQKLSLHRGII